MSRSDGVDLDRLSGAELLDVLREQERVKQGATKLGRSRPTTTTKPPPRLDGPH